jgi:hypothetical protein
MESNPRLGCQSILFWVAVPLLLGALGFVRPAECGMGDVWQKTSDKAVVALDHPTIEEELERRGGYTSGYRFAVFGDQRALADGEWQEIVKHIARISKSDDSLIFVLDTGDIVNNGFYSDQFDTLAGILRPVSHLPYLVAVGNHEKKDNEKAEALRNTAACLNYLDADFRPDRMYYKKDIGPARFLFLDTNDLLYGDDGDGDNGAIAPDSRAEAQIEWLVGELAGCAEDGVETAIVVMHHPLVQSSRRHRPQSVVLWNLEYGGSTLAESLFHGGVDLILTGHTHTYERFVIRSGDGREMDLINISGRPRGGLMWLGALSRLWGGGVSRKSLDLTGREDFWFTDSGWAIPSGWSIVQADAMLEDEANQFGVFTIEADGGILLEMAFLDDGEPGGLRWAPTVRIK